jgi:hypothetical protein
MPADPKVWTILDRLRADLAAVVADANHHYHPHLVKVVRVFVLEDFDESLGTGAGDPATIYLVRRGGRTIQRDSTGDNTTGPRDKATVEIQVLVAQRFTASSDSDTPTEALVVERMLADVIRVLTFEDPGLGISIDSDDVLTADDTEVEEMPPGWAVAVIRFQVSYLYFSTAA